MERDPDKMTKKDFIFVLVFVLIFFFLILGPKIYWLPDGGFVFR